MRVHVGVDDRTTVAQGTVMKSAFGATSVELSKSQKNIVLDELQQLCWQDRSAVSGQIRSNLHKDTALTIEFSSC